MADETKKTPTPEEVKAQESAKAEAEKKAKADAEAAKDAKVGDIVKTEDKPEEVKAKMVPEAVFLEEKRERKELARQVKELTELIKEGASKKEVSADVKEIAEEFGLTEQAVAKLIAKVGEQTKAEYEKEIEAKLAPIQEKERSEKAQKTFDEHFDKLMEAMPEFKGIATKEAVRSLTLDPRNANKTFAKILEDSFGHLVTGKKTIEKTQARGGVSDTPIDFEKAKKDMAYYKEIMDNPELKKEYNKSLIERLKL